MLSARVCEPTYLRSFVVGAPVIIHTNPSWAGVQRLQPSTRTIYVMQYVEDWFARSSASESHELQYRDEGETN